MQIKAFWSTEYTQKVEQAARLVKKEMGFSKEKYWT